MTDDAGFIKRSAITKLCGEVAALRSQGHQVLTVTSGAIAAGLPIMKLEHRPHDVLSLQAAAAVGQSRLLRYYDEGFSAHGLVSGQILLSPTNFFDRRQYLHARASLLKLLELGVVPIVNENDAVKEAEPRFGDNDRLAALVAHVVKADLLVLLTDTQGLYTADPRHDSTASLVEEVQEIDQQLLGAAGGAGSARGSGGMASKLSAARMAAWSGIRTVIASAEKPAVLQQAIDGATGVGTVIAPRNERLSARKLWIAFAVPAVARVIIDDGAVRALVERGASLLAAGVIEITGDFESDEGVEIVSEAGEIVAKGLASCTSQKVVHSRSKQHADSRGPADIPQIVHRDQMVVFGPQGVQSSRSVES